MTTQPIEILRCSRRLIPTCSSWAPNYAEGSASSSSVFGTKLESVDHHADDCGCAECAVDREWAYETVGTTAQREGIRRGLRHLRGFVLGDVKLCRGPSCNPGKTVYWVRVVFHGNDDGMCGKFVHFEEDPTGAQACYERECSLLGRLSVAHAPALHALGYPAE